VVVLTTAHPEKKREGEGRRKGEGEVPPFFGETKRARREKTERGHG
jgi:hypothetical protein